MKNIICKTVYIVLSCITCMSFADAERTNILSFTLPTASVHGVKKIVNNTKKAMSLKWHVYDRQADKFYAQEPLVKPKSSCVIDLTAAKNYLQHKSDKTLKFYEVSLSIGIVPKPPLKPRVGMVYRGLKQLESGIYIPRKEFLNNDVFELRQTSQGKIFYKPEEHKKKAF